jgi:hypothetical protein
MPKLVAAGLTENELWDVESAKSKPVLTWEGLTYSVNDGAKTIIDDCSGTSLSLSHSLF